MESTLSRPQSILRTHKGILAVSLMLLLLSSPLYAGFIILFFLVFTYPYLLIKLLLNWKTPSRRHHTLTSFTIFSLSLLIVTLLHAYYHFDVRAKAEDVKNAILFFKAEEGRYPDTLEELKTDLSRSYGRYRVFYFKNKDGIPALFHLHTFFPFSTYQYDFQEQTWISQLG